VSTGTLYASSVVTKNLQALNVQGITVSSGSVFASTIVANNIYAPSLRINNFIAETQISEFAAYDVLSTGYQFADTLQGNLANISSAQASTVLIFDEVLQSNLPLIASNGDLYFDGVKLAIALNIDNSITSTTKGLGNIG
jgi:hypothetical protein